MTKDTDGPKVYLAADASKIVRCAWCGYLVSVIEAKPPQSAFCSGDCAAAMKLEENRLCMICYLPSILILTTASTLTAPSFVNAFSMGLLLFLLFILSSFPILLIVAFNVYKGGKTRVMRPKLSRYNDESPDFFLLRTASQHVECPNCDGNIDLSTVKEDMVYHCEYCGASGKVEILKTGEQ
ncbi:MAG: hypothetical protein ACFFD6_03715 [Candidatus Thorarchaeota archaeon]